MKRLIVCCDGTWNNPEKEHVTNVVKAARSIYPVCKDGTVQEVFYDWGVGSYCEKVSGGISGKGIEKNIRDGYRFIVHNFEPHDRIYLFGYSRGAYTVRSLAGFIRNCGILKKQHSDKILKAFKLYRNRRKAPKSVESKEFRKKLSFETDIAFIGVWDTVGSLGIPLRILKKHNLRQYAFHDTKLSRIIKYACHALAIDEMRTDFKPTLWSKSPANGQKMVQEWFSGSHGDVGGGHKEAGLSDITLNWMLKHAQKAGLGVDKEYLKKTTHENALGMLHISRKGIYCARGKHVRPIGKLGDKLEGIHPSVKTRWQRKINYRPENLKTCFKEKRLKKAWS